MQFSARAMVSLTCLIAIGCEGGWLKNALPAPLNDSFPYEFEGRFRRAHGGDNFELFRGRELHYVVIIGIDSPKPGQDYYEESKEALRKTLLNQTVKVVVHGRDDFERELGHVYLVGKKTVLQDASTAHADAKPDPSPDSSSPPAKTPTERNIGLEMIDAGHAWFDGHQFECWESYRDAQQSAQRMKSGLWQQDNPMPPWDFVPSS